MRVLNDTAMEFAPLVGKVRYPDNTLTLIVKGTFDLRHGGPVTPAEEQLPATGDEYGDPDDIIPRYPHDFAHFKPKADLLLIGRCHAPGGDPVAACKTVFQVGRHRCELLVRGDCYWKRGFGFSTPEEPEPFRSMDLGWQNAFGGPGYEWNMAGKGLKEVDRPGGGRAQPLPNVQYLDSLATSKRDRPVPGGYGPVHRDWKPRAGKLGTYKGKWAKTRWPFFPEDFDWTWYNVAPERSQVEYLRGDEEILFENMHPDIPEYSTVLPGIKVRCLLDPTEEAGGDLQEVGMNLDTLWVDMEAEKLVLVWRGITPVPDDDLAEFENVVIFQEPVLGPSLNREECRELLSSLVAREDGGTPPRMPDDENLEESCAREEAAVEASLEEAGVDLKKIDSERKKPTPEEEYEAARKFSEEHGIPDEDMAAFFMPPLTVDQLMERYRNGESLEKLSLEGLDLSGRELRGADLSGAILSGARLVGANLEKAVLREAVMRQADLEDAVLDGADLTRAYLADCRMRGVGLRGAVLDGASLSNCNLEKAVLAGSTADGADLSSASMDEADLTGVEWEMCDLTGSTVREAAFNNASLQDCEFAACKGRGAEFDGARLQGARMGEGADLSEASFREVYAPWSVWTESVLDGADFSMAQLTGAAFSRSGLREAVFDLARCREAMFDRADLSGASMVNMDGFQATFEKAELIGTDLTGANLYEAEFLDARVEKAVLEGANLKMSKLG